MFWRIREQQAGAACEQGAAGADAAAGLGDGFAVAVFRPVEGGGGRGVKEMLHRRQGDSAQIVFVVRPAASGEGVVVGQAADVADQGGVFAHGFAVLRRVLAHGSQAFAAAVAAFEFAVFGLGQGAVGQGG